MLPAFISVTIYIIFYESWNFKRIFHNTCSYHKMTTWNQQFVHCLPLPCFKRRIVLIIQQQLMFWDKNKFSKGITSFWYCFLFSSVLSGALWRIWRENFLFQRQHLNLYCSVLTFLLKINLFSRLNLENANLKSASFSVLLTDLFLKTLKVGGGREFPFKIRWSISIHYANSPA